MLIRDLKDGDELDRVLLVRELETRSRRDGAEYLRVVFADRSGQLAAMIWDEVAEVRELLVTGQAVRVIGRYGVHTRYGPQLNIRELGPVESGSFSLDELLPSSPRDAAKMEGDLRELIATIQQPHIRRLLDRMLGDGGALWQSYRTAPAAKYYHQAYRHGLLEHCLSVAQAVSALSATFPGIDRDVAVAGALLHDIGKLEAYASNGTAIEMTDAGRLQGEIALGYYRVRNAIEQIEDFPGDLAAALTHIVLSHHGTLEHGSPVVPCTREATLVHMADNLGGRLGSFDRLEQELRAGDSWSPYDRALGSTAYFASVPAKSSPPVQRSAPADILAEQSTAA